MKEDKIEKIKSKESLEQKEENQMYRLYLVDLATELLEEEKLIKETGGFLDIHQPIEEIIYHEGSPYLGTTLGMIFAYGVDRKAFEKTEDTLYKMFYESKNYDKEKIRELQPLKGLSILDIGGGTEGKFARFLRELGADAKVLDFRKPEKDDGVVFQGDITKAETIPEEIKNKKFDLVVSTMTFVTEIIDIEEKEGEQALPNALSLVKDDGYFIAEPNMDMRYGLPDDKIDCILLSDNLKNEGFIDLHESNDPRDWPLSAYRRNDGPTVIHKKAKRQS